MEGHFPVLFLLARPGAGKSEVIRFLKGLDPAERLRDYHVGELAEIDDFPMLWTWFEEDAILRELGNPALYTDDAGYFKDIRLWDLLIRRIGLEYSKFLRDHPDWTGRGTVLVEFSRGVQHGGFRRAFEHLSPELLNRGSALYIDVSWEESLRKNRSRFNPEKPDSILEHGLSDEKLEFLYRRSDWSQLAPDPEGLLTAGTFRVPYAVMPNEDDVTTPGGPALAERLKDALERLWRLHEGTLRT